MPWCDDCSRFWSPNTLPASGACPTCGRPLGPTTGAADGDEYHAPWHFKVMVGLAALYLTWRFLQLLGWLV